VLATALAPPADEIVMLADTPSVQAKRRIIPKINR
jgi:hypothetical protein